MPDKVMTSTTAGACACCEVCALVVSAAVDGGDFPAAPPIDDGSFFTSSTATAYLASNRVQGCWLAIYGSSTDPWGDYSQSITSISNSITGLAYAFDVSLSSSGGVGSAIILKYAFKVYIFAATGLSIGSTLVNNSSSSPSQSNVYVYPEGGGPAVFTSIQSTSGPASELLSYSVTVPSDGYYIVYFDTGTSNASSFSISMGFTLDEGSGHCPVQALYAVGSDPFDPENWRYMDCP